MERVAPISSFRLISPPLGVMVPCSSSRGGGSSSLLDEGGEGGGSSSLSGCL